MRLPAMAVSSVERQVAAGLGGELGGGESEEVAVLGLLGLEAERAARTLPRYWVMPS